MGLMDWGGKYCLCYLGVYRGQVVDFGSHLAFGGSNSDMCFLLVRVSLYSSIILFRLFISWF